MKLTRDPGLIMNLFKISSRWIAIQLRRAVLATCPQKTYQGFVLYAAEDEEEFFDMTIKALKKIENVDTRRYKRVKKYINSIAYAKSGEDAYITELRAFFVDTFQKDIEDFACGIVHEAMHGYLMSKGFSYEEATAERHERICVQEQIAFFKKVVATRDIPDKEREVQVESYRNRHINFLKDRWWNPNIQREKKINRLKSIFFRKYIHQEHDANGRLIFECQVINGKKNGYFKLLDEDGALAMEGNYVNDQFDGIIKEYYPGGSLKVECCWLKDEMDGDCKSFFENGTLKDAGTYKNGHAHGVHLYFKEDGSLIKEAVFENGDVVDPVKKQI